MAPHPQCAISLFAGGGGLELGLARAVAGLRTVCYVEREAYAAACLVARMESAQLDPALVWDDVVTFDGRPFRGLVDLVAGGFPCQDISNAGKRAGLAGARSGLWWEFARIIGEVEPEFVFIENVAALKTRGLDSVLGELDRLGYRYEWDIFRASDVGAPHKRARLFILAHAEREQLRDEPRRRGGQNGTGAPIAGFARAELADAHLDGREGLGSSGLLDRERTARGHYADGRGGAELVHAASLGRLERWAESAGLEGRARAAVAGGEMADANGWDDHGREQNARRREVKRAAPSGTSGSDQSPREWPPGPNDADGWREVLAQRPDLEPAVRRMADGLAHRVERLRLLGNGVVPAQAAHAYRILHERIFGGR